MDSILLKVVLACLMLNIVGLTTAAPLNDQSDNFSTRIKRLPADGFSFAGFKPSVPKPIIQAQETITKFATNLFKPSMPRHRNRENTDNKVATKIEEEVFKNVTSATVKNVNNENSTNELHTKDSATEKHVFKSDLPIDNKKESNDNEKQTSNEPNVSSIKSYGEANKKNLPELDEEIIEAIFKEVNKNVIDSTTTEDSTMDYTTETGDYESTTTDELLRIPSAVVASLLG